MQHYNNYYLYTYRGSHTENVQYSETSVQSFVSIVKSFDTELSIKARNFIITLIIATVTT